MLVLTRKRSEMIKIGDDVVVKVIQTGRGTVKIGIQAPSHVRVLRGELSEHPLLPPEVEDAVLEHCVEQLLGHLSDQFPVVSHPDMLEECTVPAARPS